VDRIQLSIEIAKLAVAIGGAIVVAWYWNRQKHKLEQYQYLDEAYNEILKTYFDCPQFGQPELTSKYGETFKGSDIWRYHYFSMRVHTFLESIYDLSNGKIPVAWAHIYRHHAALHSAWLRDHPDLHEPGYVKHALNP
jgi:hypothetical protein